MSIGTYPLKLPASLKREAERLANAYTAACTKELSAAGLPVGTQCQVDVQADKVTIVSPPTPPAEKKPEAAKK